MRMLVLGAGLQGSACAYDLLQDKDVEQVRLASLRIDHLPSFLAPYSGRRLLPTPLDVRDEEAVRGVMRESNAVMSALPYYFNFQMARLAVAEGVHFTDLGGNTEIVNQQKTLDLEARRKNITIVPDSGLAPGMVSILAVHGAGRFDQIDEIHIRVGGLPQDPQPPLNYQIVFSVEGLINEYVERARVIRNGQIVEVDSLTEIERLEFPEPFGEMEAFQTSGGTSTLPENFLGRVQKLDYKTIRYPGHCEQFKLLIDLGLATSEEVDVDGLRVRPRRVLGEMLLRHLPADEPDVVLIRVEFRGVSEGAPKRLRYDIIDRFDETTGLSAMMRTTAFPASIIAQMMASGQVKQKGALPQELCIPPDDFVIALTARNIIIRES